MSEKTVAEKAHVKEDTTFATVNPVPDVIESLGLPADVQFVDVEHAQIVLLFVANRSELESLMPDTLARLAPRGTIWVFYRKGAKSAGLDMSRNDVWAIAEKNGMRPLGLVSVDATWSAFRLQASR